MQFRTIGLLLGAMALPTSGTARTTPAPPVHQLGNPSNEALIFLADNINQTGKVGRRTSGCTSKESIANGGPLTASVEPFDPT